MLLGGLDTDTAKPLRGGLDTDTAKASREKKKGVSVKLRRLAESAAGLEPQLKYRQLKNSK